MNAKLKDKFLLIFSALGSAMVIALVIALVRKRVSREWGNFIYSSIVYLIVLIALGFTAEQIKRLSKARILLFQLVFYLLTVGIVFLIFRAGLLPMPKGGLTYVPPMTALSILSIVVLNYIKKRSNLFDGHRPRH
jgi:predicted Abi (CAAX) family protease